MDTIAIEGPHGRFEVCANSGQMMTPYSKRPKPYRMYSAADVREYKAWCERNSIPCTPAHILNIRMFRFDGKTEPVLEEYREEWLTHRNLEEAKVA